MNIHHRIIGLMALLSLTTTIMSQTLHITTPGTSLVLSADEGQPLRQVYYGARLSSTDLGNIQSAERSVKALPEYGMDCTASSGLAVRHADGNMTLQLVVDGTSTSTEDGATVTTVRLRDKVYPFTVNVCYKAFDDADVIETWTEISHGEKKPVTLNRYASAQLAMRRGDVWISHLHGAWGNEAQLTEEPLTPGTKLISNTDGVRNSQTDHAEVMFSLDGKPQENTGRVIGAALCYSGNYTLRVVTAEDEYHHFYAGINEDQSAYSLPKGETFRTPELAITYSAEGLSGSSRNFHRWARLHKLANGQRLRKILLNSWEGVYMNITEDVMDQMMGDIADMGGELFVMDDGWFGSKHARNYDNAGLGDWFVNTEKLPNGVPSLVEHAKSHGIDFGIWIEPEMTNTASELYEKHPDWVVKAPQRDAITGRGGTQLVLDLSNPAVQDFVFKVVDDLMQENPSLDYIKWDANMSIFNHGSQYLSADNQSHLYIEYHRGLQSVCQRIRQKYPELTIQACASGGGRASYGLLPYFDEFWTSDNTDALQRIRMQWGTSYFFPACAMAAHISAAPNHQTGRSVPLKYRIDVAMSGRLGMEIQPKDMSQRDKEICRQAIADYKLVRPVVQQGDIYRLLSPFDNKGVASLMYVSEDKGEAVFFWWKTEHYINQHLPRIPMAGLDAAKTYEIHELDNTGGSLPFEGKSFTGAYLMANGLDIPYGGEYSSRVLRLVEK